MPDVIMNTISAIGTIMLNVYSVVNGPPLHLSCVVSTDISSASSIRYAINIGDVSDDPEPPARSISGASIDTLMPNIKGANIDDVPIIMSSMLLSLF